MTKEVRYIIENKRFKKSWSDLSMVFDFVYPLVIGTLGIFLLFESGLVNKLIGSILFIATILLTRLGLLRVKLVMEFEELTTKLNKDECFAFTLQALKKMNIVEFDKDYHNHTINAKFKSKLLPPLFEWLTIVCLDNKVLINSRPFPLTIFLWVRRTGLRELKSLFPG